MVRRRSLTVAAVLAGTLAVPAAGHAATCLTPGSVKAVQRSSGVVTVSWRPSARLRRGKPSYRVLRGSAVVGQTRRMSMTVRDRPGRTVTVKVGVVGDGGSAPRCWSRRRVTFAAVAPSKAPRGLAVRPTGDRTVRLTWTRLRGARGYRVLRDGAVVGQTRAASMSVAVRPGATHLFAVAALDAAGRPGRPSRSVRFAASTRAPGAPGGLQAPLTTSNAARISWNAAAPGSAPVRAYRLLRDGRVVGQTTATQADVTGLQQDRQYALSVSAVDTRGVVGPASTVTVRTALPAPTRGRLHAFVLASTDESFRALQGRYGQVGTVYPTYFDCLPADPKSIAGKDDPLITRWAKDRRIRVMPRFNCQRPGTLRTILTQPDVRRAVIDGLVAVADAQDYDGINLDLEAGAPQDRDPLTAFVAELAGALHASGRKLTVDVSPKVRDVQNHPRSTFYDYRALSQHADWIWVMSWGLHWQTSAPGPLSPADWLAQVTGYVATLAQKERFVLGLPLYGFDWPAGGGPAHPAVPRTYAEIQALVARTGAAVRRDPTSGELTFSYTDEQGVGHEVWFADGASVATRLRLADQHGLGGIGVWRLGQEDPALWDQPGLAG